MKNLEASKDFADGAEAAVGQVIALIDERPLERECLLRSIELLHPRLVILGYPSAARFRDTQARGPVITMVLLNIGSRDVREAGVVEEIVCLVDALNHPPVVIVSASDDLHQIVAAQQTGASGYIPASIGIDGIVEAASLAASGGVFLRFESLTKLCDSRSTKPISSSEFGYLTSRQTAVAEALRRGKANKTIAYELNMCESTVKVHIRNLMRKLDAKNRTEAAYKLNAILPQTAQSGLSEAAPRRSDQRTGAR